MKKEIWGPCIWKTLHVLTVKIKDDAFKQHHQGLIELIILICNNLPCPNCSTHAQGLIRKFNLKGIKTKDDLIRFVFLMHNEVNKRLKKPLYLYENIKEQYGNTNTRDVLLDYYNKNIQIKFGERMMLHSFHKKLFLKIFKSYMQKNIHLFDD